MKHLSRNRGRTPDDPTPATPASPPEAADAGYIHTMAVRPACMGRQLGKRMLEWAISHIRGRGKRFARLDCMTANPRLRAYYESAGFHYRGDGLSGAYQLALYELPLWERKDRVRALPGPVDTIDSQAGPGHDE